MGNKIIEFKPKTKQLELPLVWWRDAELWRERHHVSSVDRPTEDAALDNIYYASRVRNVDDTFYLNGFERKIYKLELWSINNHPKWYTPVERNRWIAARLGMTIHEVKDTLKHIDYILRCAAKFEVYATSEKKGQAIFRELVKEVMREAMREAA